MDVIHLLTPSAPRPIAPFSHGVTELAGSADVEIDLLAAVAT